MNPTNGKGSKPRKVDPKKFADNWEQIFGNKEYPDDQLSDNPDPKPVDEHENCGTDDCCGTC